MARMNSHAANRRLAGFLDGLAARAARFEEDELFPSKAVAALVEVAKATIQRRDAASSPAEDAITAANEGLRLALERLQGLAEATH